MAALAGTAFGPWGEGFLRLSYANSVPNIEAALDAIRSVTALCPAPTYSTPAIGAPAIGAPPGAATRPPAHSASAGWAPHAVTTWCTR